MIDVEVRPGTITDCNVECGDTGDHDAILRTMQLLLAEDATARVASTINLENVLCSTCLIVVLAIVKL